MRESCSRRSADGAKLEDKARSLKKTVQVQRTEIADLRAQVSQNGHKRNRETSLAVQKALHELMKRLTDMAVTDHVENKKAMMRMFPEFEDALARIASPPSQTSPPCQTTNCAQSASEYETESEEDDPAPAQATAARAKAIPKNVAAAVVKAPAPLPTKAASSASATDEEASAPSTVVASRPEEASAPSTVAASQPEEASAPSTAVASQNEEAAGSQTLVASQPDAPPPPLMSGGNTVPLGDRQQPTAGDSEVAVDVAP
jgi:hypothetical protein